MMFGDEPALAIEQTERTASAEPPYHRAGRMRHIGVERCAKERQPAGHGRLDVRAQSQRPPRHLWHAGKAAIELDRIESLGVAAYQFRHRLEHRVLRVTFRELVALEV